MISVGAVPTQIGTRSGNPAGPGSLEGGRTVNRKSGDRSNLSRERIQFVLIIMRLIVEALKMGHGWLSS